MSIQSTYPAIKPTLLCDFANTEILDPRITCSRASGATFFDQFGIMRTAASGVPRFEHNPVTFESLGLLIEEQRTNLLTYAEDFSNAAWTKSASTITANATLAPDGTSTADKLVEDTANTGHNVSRSQGVTTNLAYALTIYAKKAERSFFRLQSFNATGDAENAVFNLTSGTIVSGTAGSSITPVGNDWFRCYVPVVNNTDTASTLSVQVYLDGTTPSYTGDGTSGIFIWGAQLEVGEFPTSYIQTVASQVTRAADVASMTSANFTSWFNPIEGTIYCESQTAQGANAFPWSLFGSSTDNRIFANYTTTQRMEAGIRVSAVLEASAITPASSAPLNTLGKSAIAYKANDFGLSWNGAAAITDTSTSLPAIVEFDIGNNGGIAGNFLNGTIRKIAYYPQRVTNAQLQGLTT